MINLTATLGAGMLLLVLVFYLLHRYTPLNGKQAALVAGLLTITLYLPYAMLRWPGADVVTIHFAIYLVTAYVLGIIAVQRDAQRSRGEAGATDKWFHWGPAAIVIFFVVIIAVDTVFVTLAVKGLPKGLEQELLPAQLAAKPANTRFPGIVHDHYWQKETAYNDYLRRVAQQRKQGWRVREGWLTPRPRVGRQAVLQVAVQDRDGRAISGAEVAGRFLRASDSRLDRSFTMDEAAPGVYRVSVRLPQPGTWALQLKVRRGGQVHELRASTTIYR